MEPKKGKKMTNLINLEIIGAIIAVLLIICALAALLDMDNAQGLLTLATGLGVLLNGILAWLRLEHKNMILGAVLTVGTITLLVLFILQMFELV